ncbi:MAG: hypothetical protein JWP52_2525, partial [Rhizobacter sp.]|nr:hypothetical protein [Rhizobacter sp.]
MNTCTPSARTTSAPSASRAGQRRRARRQAPAFVARPTATAVAAMLLIHGAAFALPQDGKPTFGNTTTQQSGNSLTIQQTSGKAGINWGSFSIQAGEKVTIVQPSSGSVLVNRVVGPDPSSILGNLSANGQVFLINPQGVVFGSGSQVNVGGLVATSLSMSDADAQAGRLRLQPNADGRAGPVSNAGTITARNGTVALVAPQVANTGTIDARRVGMAAASEVVVDLEGDGLILFNTGAADDAKLEQLGRIRAEGGPVQLQAAARNALAGTVLNLQGAVVARGITELVGGGQSGGTVVVDGGSNGITQVGGSIDAAGVGAGQKGGDVTVLGSKVLLGAQASINASGDAGGGRIRVGGDYQGSNPGLKNADMVTVLAGARLDASATGQGDGGTVIVWSDDATRFHGDIAARGGERGGNGGLVEVSGKGFLDYQGAVDTRAPLGAAGTLLLDPTNLTISTGPADINGDGSTSDDLINPTLAFGAPGVNSVITAAAVENQLATSNVTLQATNDITVSTSINASIPRELTLQAGNNINVFADLNGMSIVTLSANDPGSSARVATGRVSVTGSISTATSGTINITNNAGTGVNLVQGAVSGGGIVLNGTSTLSGTVALQGIAVDAGVTTINGATLQNRPDVSIAAGAGVVFTDNQTIGGLNGDGTVVLPVTGTLTLNPVADATYAGVISGTGNVFKDGTGKQTFSGDNTYSGTTDNRGYGTLQVGDGGNTGTIGTGAFFSDSTFVVNRSNDYLISNAIPGNGFGVLTQAGVGRTVVTSSNAFDQVNVEAGTLEVRGPTASIGNSGATVNVASAATLDVTDGAFINGTVQLNGGTIANSTGNGAVAGDVNLTANSTFQSGGPVFAAGANLTFTGTVSDGFVDSSQSGTPHGITKTGTGTVRLAAVND